MDLPEHAGANGLRLGQHAAEHRLAKLDFDVAEVGLPVGIAVEVVHMRRRASARLLGQYLGFRIDPALPDPNPMFR